MHIRKLELLGFKSFPDRTTFHFGPGISGVVGPNGCGKSNIVDAIKWCLGEQSAKSLRGQAMADVIFAGSADRKPSAMAEVTLHFDSGDEPFPGEWSQHPELAITRRLFRDGGSEYRVNQQKVRLKDIQDLFLDSGVANRLYSFIEQGRIGEIVNARPEQRRTLIEEAAGISRYKARRKEAESKLSSTLENLDRVSDTVGRLAGRMRSLERQVAKAMRYRRLRSHVRQAEILLGLARFSGLTGDRRALAEQLRVSESKETELANEVKRREAALREARAEAEALETVAAAVRDELAEVEASRREREQVRQFQSKERTDLIARIDVLKSRTVEADAAQSTAAGRLEELERERAEVHGRLMGMENELDEARQEVQSAEGAVRERRRRIEQAKSGVLERAKRLARARAELDTGGLRREDFDRREQRLQTETESELARGLELRAQVAELESAVQKNREAAEVAAEAAIAALGRLESARASEQTARDIRRDAQKSLLDAERAVVGAKARAESIERMVAGEGDAQGALKAALLVEGALGRLGSMLEVPADLEQPLAMVLREFSDAVVVESIDVVQDVASAVEGRVDLILAGDESISGMFADVGGDPRAVGALARLVRDIGSSDSLQDALHDWTRSASGAVCGGGFVSTNGVVRLGAPGGAAVLLSRRRELSEAETAVEEAVAAQRAARAAHGAAVTAAEQSAAAVDSARDGLAVARAAQRDAEQLARESVRDEEALRARLERHDASAAQRTNDMEEVARLREKLAEREAVLERQIIEDESEQDRLERALQVEQVALNEEGRGLSEARDVLGTRAQEAAAFRERVVGLDRSRAEVRAARDGAQRQSESSRAEVDEATKRIAELESQDAANSQFLVEVSEKSSELQETLDVARAQVSERRLAAKTVDEAWAAARGEREAATGERQELERRLVQVKEDLTQIRSVLDDRYEVSVVSLLDRVERLGNVVLEVDPAALRTDLPEAAAMTEDDERITKPVRVTAALLDDEPALTDWTDELEDSREQLRKLGEVNLVALIEYGEVAEEHAELDQQRTDLDESVRSIRQTIARLNRISRERFRDTFERVDGWFREVYPRLVGGGQARLQLTDEEDMLDTGVDIFVQPPGKRLQNLSLLSGGETAMVAIALIFSLFRVKPSPFCLLDEVDAPLDEGNGARFNNMLSEMAELSQFILVTHNKKTMECADTLYGVTMPTAGVSRLVSVKLDG